jgi:polyketide cyclase/dehydrase/lipid transport protein
MRHFFAAIFAAAVIAPSDASAGGPTVRVWDVQANVAEAVVDVHASPDAIYRVVTNYAQWPGLFSDVRKVSVLSGGPRDATVRFESQTLERQVTVRFDNGPDSVRFQLVDGPPGVKSTGKFVVEPGQDPSWTRIRGSLFMDASFPASMFVSAKKLAWMRHTKLSRDLEDLRKRFL